MLANKDPSAIIEPLAEKLDHIIVVPVPGHAHHQPEDFASVVSAIPMLAAQDVQEAITQISPKPSQSILIAGSLYLAGEVLKLNDQLPD